MDGTKAGEEGPWWKRDGKENGFATALKKKRKKSLKRIYTRRPGRDLASDWHPTNITRRK